MEAAEPLDSTTFTRAEMFKVLRDSGLEPPTTREFSEWITKGLIDRHISGPRAEQGKDIRKGRWPRSQLDLLAIIVANSEAVRKSKAPIAALANIPTLWWLRWGEERVPIRQVRRAVGTWAKFHQTRRGASGPVTDETHRLARAIKGDGALRPALAFADRLADLTVSKRLDVPPELLDLGEKVIDPRNSETINTENLAALIVADQYATEHAVRDHAADLRHSTKFWFTDLHYRQARTRWSEAANDYHQKQPLLRATGPADLYEPLTLDDVVNRACQDVLLHLALADSRLPWPSDGSGDHA